MNDRETFDHIVIFGAQSAIVQAVALELARRRFRLTLAARSDLTTFAKTCLEAGAENVVTHQIDYLNLDACLSVLRGSPTPFNYLLVGFGALGYQADLSSGVASIEPFYPSECC